VKLSLEKRACTSVCVCVCVCVCGEREGERETDRQKKKTPILFEGTLFNVLKEKRTGEEKTKQQ